MAQKPERSYDAGFWGLEVVRAKPVTHLRLSFHVQPIPDSEEWLYVSVQVEDTGDFEADLKRLRVQGREKINAFRAEHGLEPLLEGVLPVEVVQLETDE